MGHEIESLRRYADVRVISFISQAKDAELAASVPGAETVRVSPLTRALNIALHPWMPAYFAARTSMRFRRKFLSELRRGETDVIYAEYLQMGQYMALRRLFPDVEFHLVAHDVCSQSYKRRLEKTRGLKAAWLKWELKKIKKYEERYFSEADRVLTFSAKDRRLIEEISGRDDIEFIHTYVGIPDEELLSAPDLSQKEDGSVLFLGQMSRPENASAAMRLVDICAKVREDLPDLKLYIVGHAPDPGLSALVAGKDWIDLTGYVEDVDIYIKKASIAVFPLTQGAGIKVKVLRSMALGTPVITGEVGAEGIDEDGTFIRLAETDDEYVDAVKGALCDPGGTRALGIRSHEFIADNFAWSATDAVFRRLYGT